MACATCSTSAVPIDCFTVFNSCLAISSKASCVCGCLSTDIGIIIVHLSFIVTFQVPDSCCLRRRVRRRRIWGHLRAEPRRPRQEDCVPLHPLLSSYLLFKLPVYRR